MTGRPRLVPPPTAPQATAHRVADEIDIIRGDVLAAPRERPVSADQFSAHVIWMSGTPQ